MDGVDNNDMVEFRYEICVFGKKISRFKFNRDLREDRLCGKIIKSSIYLFNINRL